VSWSIADGYYLYRDKISITLADSSGVTAGAAELPEGETKHDEFFGDVQVFHNDFEVRVPLQRSSGAAVDISVQLDYQGCAEAGICYPPIKKQLPLRLAAFDPASVAAAVASYPENSPAAQASTCCAAADWPGSYCSSSVPVCCWHSPPACTR